MELYTKILTNFPHFRGYFDAMYRSCIVGKHIAELMIPSKQREETLNKCIDMLQFLLESLPISINEVRRSSILNFVFIFFIIYSLMT